MTRKIALFCLCLLLLPLGCTTSTPTISSILTTTAVPSTDTPSPVPSPTVTVTSTPVPIVLPAVTMSPQEAETALQELLKTNGNCTGKCVAGIRPDEMTVQEAVNQMTQWGMLWMSKGKDGGIGIHNLYLDPNSKQINISLDIILRKKSEATYGVSFRVPRFEYGAFLGADVWLENRESWEAFRLDNLLRAYGVPSFIGFRLETWEPKGKLIAYTIDIHYKELNLEIGIGGLANKKGKDVFLCPSKDPHSLGIDINPYPPLIERQQASPITWQALTDSDLQTFYQTFTSGPDACPTTTLEKIMALDPYFR